MNQEYLYRVIKKWNKSFNNNKQQDHELFSITQKLDEQLNNVIKLALNLSEYRFQQHEDYNNRLSLKQLKNIKTNLSKEDVLVAIKILFHHRLQSIYHKKSVVHNSEDTKPFTKQLITKYIQQNSHPFYHNKIVLDTDALVQIKQWLIERLLVLKDQNKKF